MSNGKINVHKAQAMPGCEVPSCMIDVIDVIPEFESLVVSRMCYESDARLLFDALKASLPGGTIDALLRLLLENKASLLRIPG